jgi:hypothetical protein
VTFRFEAEITEIDDPDGIGSTLPFDLALGQTVLGKVTFTPVAFGQTSAPDGRLEIHVGGESFAANELPLVTQNDVYVDAGTNVEGPFDRIWIACDQPAGCAVTESTNADITLAHVGLVANSHDFDVSPIAPDVLLVGTDVATPEVWNSLPYRLLAFELATSPNKSPITVTAAVGPMGLIPEPSTIMLTGALVVWSIGVRRRV